MAKKSTFTAANNGGHNAPFKLYIKNKKSPKKGLS